MATIYRLRYWYDGSPVEQNFLYEQGARRSYDQVLENPSAIHVEIYRQNIMRPSVKTILRILNGEPYVLKEKLIATSDR